MKKTVTITLDRDLSRITLLAASPAHEASTLDYLAVDAKEGDVLRVTVEKVDEGSRQSARTETTR